ncbi:MAG: hypothetical protein ACKVQS_07285 [Fimbriimonadaceae bacterium]
MRRWQVGLLVIWASAAQAQTVIEDFESSALDSRVMFQLPRFSGSTSGLLETKFNEGRVVRNPSPFSNLPGAGFQGYEAQFEFVWRRPGKWCRLTTFNSTGRPNPYVDMGQKLRIDLWVNAPVRMAVGLREVGGNGAIGANGGTTGSIEWVANSGLTGANGQPDGQVLVGGVWQTVEIDLGSIPRGVLAPGQVLNFAGGNSILNSPGGYTLEHLAFSGIDQHYSVHVVIDRVYMVP